MVANDCWKSKDDMIGYAARCKVYLVAKLCSLVEGMDFTEKCFPYCMDGV